jgi:hypothetical protein
MPNTYLNNVHNQPTHSTKLKHCLNPFQTCANHNHSSAEFNAKKSFLSQFVRRSAKSQNPR